MFSGYIWTGYAAFVQTPAPFLESAHCVHTLFLRAFVRSFVRSFVPSFVRLFVHLVGLTCRHVCCDSGAAKSRSGKCPKNMRVPRFEFYFTICCSTNVLLLAKYKKRSMLPAWEAAQIRNALSIARYARQHASCPWPSICFPCKPPAFRGDHAWVLW